MDTKKIGAFLKQCRKEKNLTQEQLAEKFGVDRKSTRLNSSHTWKRCICFYVYDLCGSDHRTAFGSR